MCLNNMENIPQTWCTCILKYVYLCGEVDVLGINLTDMTCFGEGDVTKSRFGLVHLE